MRLLLNFDIDEGKDYNYKKNQNLIKDVCIANKYLHKILIYIEEGRVDILNEKQVTLLNNFNKTIENVRVALGPLINSKG